MCASSDRPSPPDPGSSPGSGPGSGPAPRIRDLALIGDRRSAALLDRSGDLWWYCPGRFDAPALFAGLLDPERGGRWTLRLPGARPADRAYAGESGVLETRLAHPDAPRPWTVTDFMPLGEALPRGLVRRFEAPPAAVHLRLEAAPDFGRRRPQLEADARDPGHLVIDGRHHLYASHPLTVEGDAVRWTLPAGEPGWAALLEAPAPLRPDAAALEAWQRRTRDAWRELADHLRYRGPYEAQVGASLRALRLLTYAPTGGIVAAPTTSLPEVPGGSRNYDYRYVWLRDAAMIVSALLRGRSDGNEGRRFLEFVCGWNHRLDDIPLAPLSTLDGELAPEEVEVDLAGYADSRPVRVGNGARGQLQLDAYGNVLLAAKLIYNRFGTREHWSVVAQLADFLADRWREPDYGIWEEREAHHYTVSKVLSACGLEFLAEHAEEPEQAQRWRAAARDIRAFVEQRCRTPDGAYAVHADSDAVDVSAALFPVWAYTEADTPAMLATMEALEREHREDHLYRRTLVRSGVREGAFLAANFWVAQYWIVRGELARARTLMDAALRYANDLGLLSEEADPDSAQPLGNFPQSFVHAALVGAALDLRAADPDWDDDGAHEGAGEAG